MATARWSSDEAALRLAHPVLQTDIGVARGVPVVVVEGTPAGGLPLVAPTFPAVLVGPGGDLTEPDEAVEAAIEANPHAAVVLAQLVRVSADLPVPDALVAESLAYGVLQAGPEHATWLAGRGRRVRRPEAEPPVSVADRGDRVHVTLNRPRLRNALDAAMRDALASTLRSLAAEDDGRSIVLDGAGPAFCIGGDLAEFGTVDDPATAHHLRMATSVGLELWRLRHRVTAIVHGPCIGAGVELAAFCERVVARPDATFRLPEVAMGLIPGAGGTVSVTRRIGRRRALWLGLTGAAIDAATALDWGLVDEVEPG